MESEIDFAKIKGDTFQVSETAFGYVVDKTQKLIDESIIDISTITPLVKFIIDRSSTVAQLARLGKIWDAEIIFRSVLEVLSKLLIIATQPNKEAVDNKLDEYWVQIGEMERLRASLEVERVVSGRNMNDLDAFKRQILSQAERLDLESRITKEKRKRLSNDWSFNDILLNLSKNKDVVPLIGYDVMHYFWKMSSHIAHGDKVAMTAIRLREEVVEGKDYRSITQYLKLLKAVNNACFWAASRLAIFAKLEAANDDILTAFLAYNSYMTRIHKYVSMEANKRGFV
jgi:hypothetical protein